MAAGKTVLSNGLIIWLAFIKRVDCLPVNPGAGLSYWTLAD
jgi:hypothetical protein